jgi:hypothetical protein
MTPPNPWGAARPNLSGIALSASEKKWLGLRVHQDPTQATKLAKRFNLSRKTLEKYGRYSRQGKEIKETNGRSKVLAPEDYAELKSLASGRGSEAIAEVKSKIQELAQLRALKRGICGPQFKPVSDRTVRRIIDELGLKREIAESGRPSRSVKSTAT